MIDYRSLMINSVIGNIGKSTPMNNTLFISAYRKATNLDENAHIPCGSAFLTYIARMIGIPTAIIPNMADVNTIMEWFKTRDRWHDRNGYMPRPGDFIFFDPNVDRIPDHIGMVTDVIDNKVYFADCILKGNNSKYIINLRSYVITSKYIMGYTTPDYSGENTHCVFNTTHVSSLVKSTHIQRFQIWLNNVYNADLLATGDMKASTRSAAIIAWQTEMASTFSIARHFTTGVFDLACQRAANQYPIKRIAKNTNLVYLLQGMLYAKGYNPGKFSGVLDTSTLAAVHAFRRARHINENDIWQELFSR